MRRAAADRVTRWAVVVVLALATAACGAQVGSRTAAATTTPRPGPSLPSFPPTMNRDGTVPWSSAPAVDPYLLAKPPPVPPAAGPACTARQVRAVLPSWISNAASMNGEGDLDPAVAGSLHGYVVLTNVSAAPCTLRGVPAVTVLSGGAPIQAEYARFGASEAAKVGLPPGGKANFRIDWGTPFCPNQRGGLPGPPDLGPFSIRAEFGGLRMIIPVDSTASPSCLIGDPEPHGTESGVATSPIMPGVVLPGPVARPSTLRKLQATAGDYPRQIAAGQLLHFVITLADPTGQPVSLIAPPPPSYAIGVYCPRTPSVAGFQFGLPYSLNTGPRHTVPAWGSVRFAMQVQIPAVPLCPSPRLTITWQSPSPGFGLEGPHTTFSIALAHRG
jgi:hypothetical protein